MRTRMRATAMPGEDPLTLPAARGPRPAHRAHGLAGLAGDRQGLRLPLAGGPGVPAAEVRRCARGIARRYSRAALPRHCERGASPSLRAKTHSPSLREAKQPRPVRLSATPALGCLRRCAPRNDGEVARKHLSDVYPGSGTTAKQATQACSPRTATRAGLLRRCAPDDGEVARSTSETSSTPSLRANEATQGLFASSATRAPGCFVATLLAMTEAHRAPPHRATSSPSLRAKRSNPGLFASSATRGWVASSLRSSQ